MLKIILNEEQSIRFLSFFVEEATRILQEEQERADSKCLSEKNDDRTQK